MSDIRPIRTSKLNAAGRPIFIKHGYTGTRIYHVWQAMRARCEKPKTKQFADYGGRGIRVCERWLVFENFLADMGEPPPGMTIERRDNNAGYSPENCRWATRREQQNNRRDNRLLTFDGRTQTLTCWAKQFGIDGRALAKRLARGWPIGEALQLPPSRSNPRKRCVSQ